jgi:hypothetical protein
MYADGPCTEGQKGSYNVPRDTVISIDVSPKRGLMLSDLNIDLRKYKKTVDQLNAIRSFYWNEEDGISIGTVESEGEDNGRVLTMYYGPMTKDSHLRCKADDSRAEQTDSSTGRLGKCPGISITGPSGDQCRSQRYSFSAALVGGDPRSRPTFKWSVSAGEVVIGQGTSQIEVDASGTEGRLITATLEVGGVIPKGCPTTKSYTTECSKPAVALNRACPGKGKRKN